MSEILSSVSIDKDWDLLSAGTEFTLINPLEQDNGLNSLDLSAYADIGISDNRHLLLEADFSDETNRNDTSKETSSYYSTRLLWQEMFGRHNELSLGPLFNYLVDREYDYEGGETYEHNYSTMGIGPQINYRIQNWKLYASVLFYYQAEESDWDYLQARLRTRLNIDPEDLELIHASAIKLELEYRYKYYFNEGNDRHLLNGSFELSWDVLDWLQFDAGCGAFLNVTKEEFEISPFIGITLTPADGFSATLKFFPMESYYSSPY